MPFEDITLTQLTAIMRDRGCRSLFIKILAENDNSKNQIYLGPDFSVLNILPSRGVIPDQTNPEIFKAPLDFYWSDLDGSLHRAPNTQLILYPQYPEVRMSGFLKGCSKPPSDLMSQRLAGRVMFYGICNDGKIIGYVTSPDSTLAREIEAKGELPGMGVFFELGITPDIHPEDNREMLLTELRRIHELGWIRSKRLGSNSEILPCESSNCGGYTLEAELGITPNSFAEPDFLGWEVKQYNVSAMNRINSGVLTLMTPEPTGGYYRTEGVESFIRRFGYRDMSGMDGREDRLNFGGIHKVGKFHSRTGLAMVLKGYDADRGKIVDAGGGITLMTRDDEEAAIWHYAELMQHWKRKHSQAVYVPSICQKIPARNYSYSKLIRLGKGTDFLLYLKALACGAVYFDPGIKLENASSEHPRTKRRSQFRIKSADLPTLYHSMDTVNLADSEGN